MPFLKKLLGSLTLCVVALTCLPAWAQPGPPSPEPPVPLPLPSAVANCPATMISQTGGIFYYATVSCENSSITGYSVSSTQCSCPANCGPEGCDCELESSAGPTSGTAARIAMWDQPGANPSTTEYVTGYDLQMQDALVEPDADLELEDDVDALVQSQGVVKIADNGTEYYFVLHKIVMRSGGTPNGDVLHVARQCSPPQPGSGINPVQGAFRSVDSFKYLHRIRKSNEQQWFLATTVNERGGGAGPGPGPNPPAGQ